MANTRAELFGAGDVQDLTDGRIGLSCWQEYRRDVVLPQAMVRDAQLSFKARGILAFLLSMPLPYNYKPLEPLEHSSDKDGRDSIASGIRELISAGYARWYTTRGADGRFESTALCVSDLPVDADQGTEGQ